MNINKIVELLKQGKKPVVKLVNQLWDDSWGDKGMLARITAYRENNHDSPETMIELDFDYNEFKEHNLALQSHAYFIYKDGHDTGKLGTAFEAGMMDEKDIKEQVFYMLSDDVPVEITDSPLLSEYTNSKSKMSYVEWLEDELTRTREAYKGCLGK